MNVIKFLPKFLRIKLIRQNIHIPVKPENFVVSIATTIQELEKAYSLLHDCYVGTKLMAPDSSGLRCNFFSFLPNTTTVVAKIDETVVGTVSLIKDSPAGLPSDKDFKFENDQLRLQGQHLVEVSSLAIDPAFRKKSHVVSLYLMKYLQHYTTHHMGCTTVTCVVHPRARDFYAAFWGFKANKKVVKYKFVNDALGVHVFGNVTDQNVISLADSFPNQKNRNPINFLFNKDEFLLFPQRRIASHLDPIYTPKLLKYFMVERTQAYKNLTLAELRMIHSAYCSFFKKFEDFDFFKNFEVLAPMRRDFRFPTKISAMLTNDNENSVAGHIMDLTHEGAFFATDQILEKEKEYWIELELDCQKFSFQIMVCWRNSHIHDHQQIGYGIRFTQAQLNIAQLLRNTHLTAA